MRIGELVRCPRCSSENPPEYRFCGMCGTPLDKLADAPARSAEPVAASDRVRRPGTAPPSSQSLSGPSFLGLSGPAAGGDDVTYLFEEEQPRRTYWRFILLLLLLGGFGGLAYMQYIRSGRSWVAPWANQKPTTPVQASQQPPPPTAPAQNSTPPSAPTNGTANNQAPAQNQPGNPPQPKETELAPGSSTQPAGSSPAASSTNTPPAQATPGPPANSQPEQPAKAEAPAKQSESAPEESKVAKNEAAAEQPDTTEETPAPKAKPARVKPAPVPAPSPDDALVANAEKYLYGRGVPQNCDRALVSLRAAADRQNVRARSLLGTMYATGHCVPKDLPNAYRWFALASRQQSDNMWIQRNLEMIWREMTPQERQLAMQSNR